MGWMRRLEPLWWGLFTGGGTVAALLVTAHVFVNNIAAPLGWISEDAISYEAMARLVGNPLVVVYLAIVLGLTLFHAAHRLGPLPHELLVTAPREPFRTVAYLLATLLAAATVVILVLASVTS